MFKLPTLGNWLVIGFAFSLFTTFSNLARSQTQNTSFSVQSNLLPVNGRSGAPVGVADMNGDKKDDIVLLDNRNTLVIQTQNAPNQAFSTYQSTAIGSSQWSVCVADYDKNGRNDVLVGGAYTNIRVYSGDPATESLTGSILSNSNIFLQGSNFADIDNDGWADIFACHDDADSRKYKNNGDGSFTFVIIIYICKISRPSLSPNSQTCGNAYLRIIVIAVVLKKAIDTARIGIASSSLTAFGQVHVEIAIIVIVRPYRGIITRVVGRWSRSIEHTVDEGEAT
ncbi:MAG: VCBS repeat-containing protein, partial [Bacteroidota bacterium]